MKKVISLILTVVFVLALLPVFNASAAVTCYTEDFNNVPTSTGSFGGSTSSTLSQIFWAGNGSGCFETTTGYDGTANSALKFVQGTTTTEKYFRTKPFINTFGLTDTTPLIFNMRFKAVGAISDTLSVRLLTAGGESSGILEIKGDTAKNTYYVVRNASHGGTGDSVDITADTWYNLTVKIELTTTVEDGTTTKKLLAKTNVYNATTGDAVFSSSVSNVKATDSDSYITFFGRGFGENAGVVFDDAKVYCIPTTDFLTKLDEGSTTANSKIDADGTVKVKFNQPISATTSSFKVYESDGVTEASNAIESVLITGYDTAEVKLANLKYFSSYVLDYSGVTAVSGCVMEENAVKTLAFSTNPKPLVTEDFNNNWASYGDFGNTRSELFKGGQQNNTWYAATGYDGSANSALKFAYFKTSSGTERTASHMKTRPLAGELGLTEDTPLVFNIRFKVSGDTVVNAEDAKKYTCDFYVGNISNGFISVVGDETENRYYLVQNYTYNGISEGKTYIEADKWYNVSVKITTTEQYAYVYDSQTGELIKDSVSRTAPTITDETQLYIHAGEGFLNNGREITFDDAKLYCDKKTASLIASESTAENARIAPTDAITLKFSTNVNPTPEMFSVNSEEAYIESVGAKDFNTVWVKMGGLSYLTEYTLDYSKLLAANGTALDSSDDGILTFSTTEDPDSELSVAGDIVCNGLTAGSKITFDLYSKDGKTVDLYAAFYERYPEKFIGIETVDDFVVPASQKTPVEITLSKAYDAAKIKLFMWDGAGTLVPIIPVTELVAPVDNLKILMIGNSLSEDANRYLHKVAEAGGVTFDVTVKGIGGSTLAHHAANLKAELAGRTADEADVNNRELYFTYRNGVMQDATDENQILLNALKETQYDVISLQQFSAYRDEDFDDELPYLVTEIRKLQPNAEIVLYQTWANYGSSSTLTSRNNSFLNTVEPTVRKWAEYTGKNVSNITSGGKAMTIIPAGRAFYLADNKYEFAGVTPYETGNTDPGAQVSTVGLKNATGLWRDVNHASYYGCYLADAVWFEIFTGKKAGTTLPNGDSAVPAPTGISAAEHLARLEKLSNIAHMAVKNYN